MVYERQATMYMYSHHRRSRRKPSLELTVISISMLVLAVLSLWLPAVLVQTARLASLPRP